MYSLRSCSAKTPLNDQVRPESWCWRGQAGQNDRETPRPVALTTANDVFLDTVQRDQKIFGSVSITSWIKEHGGTYRGFVQVFPPISGRASSQSELFGIGQNALSKE